jgi:hypothetical protein
MTPVPRNLPKQNMLWEYLVNNYSDKSLVDNLKSMDFREISNFLTECDKLGSDIINGRNTMFEKSAVSVIIQVRKIAKTLGSKKLREALK